MKLGTTILIVENDNLLAETIRQSLLKDGFDVCGIAGSLKSAVDLMRKHPVDLALIDIKLDGPEDGIATAKELLKIKWIPIIYITGDSLLTALERSKDTFPAAFLEKPLRTRELFAQMIWHFTIFTQVTCLHLSGSRQIIFLCCRKKAISVSNKTKYYTFWPIGFMLKFISPRRRQAGSTRKGNTIMCMLL